MDIIEKGICNGCNAESVPCVEYGLDILCAHCIVAGLDSLREGGYLGTNCDGCHHAEVRAIHGKKL